MQEKAIYYIKKLDMMPHPEGGYYKEIYRSDEVIESEHLPERYDGRRNFSTSIYFLLRGNQISKFHRLKSDEIWHYYDGCCARIIVINKIGKLFVYFLGKDLEKNEELQIVIPKGCWFGAELVDKSSFILTGCTVSPGFDFSDFEMGKKETLLKEFPEYKNIIKKFSN
jgi:uncharacterized protein